MSPFVTTGRALLAPRRLLPLTVAGAAVVGTELWATRHLGTGAILAVAVMAFAVLVPATSRWAVGRSSWRLPVYVALCATLVLFACYGPIVIYGQQPYVAHPPAAAAMLALVVLGGWMLGRDIALEGDLGRVAARSERLAREVEDARSLALRQHLDPHFLFNTLGAIAEWCREDPEVAERALLELSAMLRLLFDGIREPAWPMSRELEVLRSLHRLHALRDDERYRLSVSAPGELPQPIPPLLLLPLFENALTHGSAEAPLGMVVDTEGDSVRISLWNAGAFGGPRPGGTGIATTERRLRIAYGAAGTLAVTPETRGGIAGTVIVVAFPARMEFTP